MRYSLGFDRRALKEWSKLKASGYRLIYQVVDREVLVWVVAIGKRERGGAYQKAKGRL